MPCAALGDALLQPRRRRRSPRRGPRIDERNGDLAVVGIKRHTGIVEGRRGEEALRVVAESVALGGPPPRTFVEQPVVVLSVEGDDGMPSRAKLREDDAL